MQTEPQREHQWLQKLVGEWTAEFECVMSPDQPPSKTTATEVVRSLGGLWIAAESDAEAPGGGTCKNIMTLGYDPEKKRFVGTFVSSMMSYLWVYDGGLDAAECVLALEAVGPNFAQGGMAKYQDRIEWVDDDHRIMTSQILNEDGSWTRFMTAHYHRKK